MTILMTKAKDEGGLDYNGVGGDGDKSTRPLSCYLVSPTLEIPALPLPKVMEWLIFINLLLDSKYYQIP